MHGKGPVISRHNWMNDAESRSFILEQAAKIYHYGRLGHLEPVEHISDRLEVIAKEILTFTASTP